MRETWYLSQVIRVKLELTANGLKDHFHDVLNHYIIELKGTKLVLCTSAMCTFLGKQ